MSGKAASYSTIKPEIYNHVYRCSGSLLWTFAVLTMMTDTPAAVLLGLGSVLKCVFSLPDTSVFMLFSKSASS